MPTTYGKFFRVRLNQTQEEIEKQIKDGIKKAKKNVRKIVLDTGYTGEIKFRQHDWQATDEDGNPVKTVTINVKVKEQEGGEV